MSQVLHPRSSAGRPASHIDADDSARATRCLRRSLAIVLLATLAACGNDDGTSGAQVSANAQQDAASQQQGSAPSSQQAAAAPSGDGLASPVMHFPQSTE